MNKRLLKNIAMKHYKEMSDKTRSVVKSVLEDAVNQIESEITKFPHHTTWSALVIKSTYNNPSLKDIAMYCLAVDDYKSLVIEDMNHYIKFTINKSYFM